MSQASGDASTAPATETASEARVSLAELYRRHQPELTRYLARAFGAGPPEPEDAVQASYAQLAAHPDAASIVNPRAFLFQSARNYMIDQKRRARVRETHATSIEAAPFADGADERHPERVLGAKEELRILAAVVRGLDPRRRAALVFNRIHGLSHVEIAKRLGISQTSSKRLLAEALAACHRALRETGSGAPER